MRKKDKQKAFGVKRTYHIVAQNSGPCKLLRVELNPKFEVFQFMSDGTMLLHLKGKFQRKNFLVHTLALVDKNTKKSSDKLP